MRFLTTLTITVCAGLALGACNKKQDAGGDSCQAVGAHFSQLARAKADEMPADHADKKAIMAEVALLPKAAAELVKECQSEKWSPELRGCFLGAKTAAEFEKNCASLVAGGAAPAAPATAPAPADEAPDDEAPADNAEPTDDADE